MRLPAVLLAPDVPRRPLNRARRAGLGAHRERSNSRRQLKGTMKAHSARNLLRHKLLKHVSIYVDVFRMLLPGHAPNTCKLNSFLGIFTKFSSFCYF